MFQRVRKRLRNLPGDDSGIVMLETVLVFPLQLLLVMLVIQLAHIYVTANLMQYAILQGTRTVLVNYRGHNGQDACRRGVRAAWAIMSTLNNPGGGAHRLRVPGNNYAFPAEKKVGAESISSSPALMYTYGMDDPAALYTGASSSSQLMVAFRTPGRPAQAESLLAGQMGYWLELVVPVGGPFVYHALDALGRPVRINEETKQGQVLMRQNARLPKPWPY